MGCILELLVVCLSWSLIFLLSESKAINLLVLPVEEDSSTGLHWAKLNKRTPLTQVPLLVDLNGNHLWVNCEQHYTSKTYQAPLCHSTQCFRANTQQCLSCPEVSRPGCHRNSCALTSTNPVTSQTGFGELGQDVLAIHLAEGAQLGPLLTVPQFLFSCAPSFLLQNGLPSNIQGVAGLGHGPISLPNQLASHFGLPRQFTMCLSRYPTSKGAIIFGDAPNNMHHFHNQDIFHDLAYTPLTITQQGEYSVNIAALTFNQHSVIPADKLTSNLLSRADIIGTMISTSTPYMIIQHSIFEVFTQMFSEHVPKQAQVKPVGPFGLCFDSKKIGSCPGVDLIMESLNGPVWRISAQELMVQPQPGVTCLAAVDGGVQPRAAFIIGARLLEEKLLVFDLIRSRLGFSTSSLYDHGVKCADLFHFAHE